MKNILKIVSVIMAITMSYTTTAQSKDKKVAKVEKANQLLLIKNKRSLLEMEKRYILIFQLKMN